MLYRKRDLAIRGHKHGGIARFRYSDLKVAAGDCGGSGLMAGAVPTAMRIESFFVCSLLILHGLGKSQEGENRT